MIENYNGGYSAWSDAGYSDNKANPNKSVWLVSCPDVLKIWVEGWLIVIIHYLFCTHVIFWYFMWVVYSYLLCCQ